MLRTNWIFRQQKLESSENVNEFLDLINTLDTVEDESLYTTEFVVALMQVIWIL